MTCGYRFGRLRMRSAVPGSVSTARPVIARVSSRGTGNVRSKPYPSSRRISSRCEQDHDDEPRMQAGAPSGAASTTTSGVASPGSPGTASVRSGRSPGSATSVTPTRPPAPGAPFARRPW